MPHLPELEPFEKFQGLAKIGPLCPRPAFEDRVAPIRDGHRILDPGSVVLEVTLA